MRNEKKQINLNAFGIIYFMLFAIPFFVNYENPFLRFPKMDNNFLRIVSLDILLGWAIGIVIVGISWFLTKRIRVFENLMREFKSVLGPLTTSEIFLIAIFSSIAEEFFFRGLVQGKLGIFFASLLFGVLHSGPGKKYIPWTVFAIVMGFVLGGTYEWRNDLLVPVVIHFVVNFVNLWLLQKYTGPLTSASLEKDSPTPAE